MAARRYRRVGAEQVAKASEMHASFSEFQGFIVGGAAANQACTHPPLDIGYPAIRGNSLAAL
jgi:hypothetical protein